MKIRYGFVTNSSSTSYVVAMKNNFELSTTDNKTKNLIFSLSKDFQSLFEILGRHDDQYSIDWISDTNEFADYILNRYSYGDNAWRYKDIIYNTKGKTVTKKEYNANEEGLKSVIKIIEDDYYGTRDSLVHWLTAIKAGDRICIMKSSHHNAFICKLMETISEADGAYLLSRDSC